MIKKDTLKAIIQNLGKLFKLTFEEWFEKDPFRQSAVIAYYAIFSIPGLLFLIITVAGSIFSREAVTQNILSQVSGTMGAAGSIILILLWVSYSSMITFFGAAFTAAYAKVFSKKVPPSEIAVVDKEAKV